MYERMLDKSCEPSAEDMASYCGENRERFHALNGYLSAQLHTTQEIRFPYGHQYGWSVTHRKGKKLICDVFAESGAFTVMLRLSDALYMSVYQSLGAHTQQLIDGRYPCGDGGWIHDRITCDEQLNDIEVLLRLKCR